jgi:hypothetical protein
MVNKSPKFKILEINNIKITHTCFHHKTYEKDEISLRVERDFIFEYDFNNTVWLNRPYLH